MAAKAFKAAPQPTCATFRADNQQPANWRGWRRCLVCRHYGDPADPADRRHPAPGSAPAPTPRRRRLSPYLAAAAKQLDARRMGEGEIGDDER